MVRLGIRRLGLVVVVLAALAVSAVTPTQADDTTVRHRYVNAPLFYSAPIAYAEEQARLSAGENIQVWPASPSVTLTFEDEVRPAGAGIEVRLIQGRSFTDRCVPNRTPFTIDGVDTSQRLHIGILYKIPMRTGTDDGIPAVNEARCGPAVAGTLVVRGAARGSLADRVPGS